MKHLLEKDKKKRYLYKSKEINWLFFKSLIHNQYISNDLKKFLYESFFKLSLNSSKVRIKNRCFITKRAGSVLSKFKISRQTFRELSLNGKIVGIIKAVW